MTGHVRGGHYVAPPMKLTQEKRMEMCATRGKHRWQKTGDGMFCTCCGQTALSEEFIKETADGKSS